MSNPTFYDAGGAYVVSYLTSLGLSRLKSDFMQDPVITADGQSYERSAIVVRVRLYNVSIYFSAQSWQFKYVSSAIIGTLW